MRRLVIRPGAIGDCILSFPALEFLRASYTEIWVPAPIVPLIDFANKVCSIASTGLELIAVGDFPIDPGLLNRLKGFDQIVSWYGTNREEFRSAIESIGVPCRFHSALPPKEEAMHATDFFCAQVGAPAGGVPRIKFKNEPNARSTLVIHPFSGSYSKNWPLSSFCILGQSLKLNVEWLAGPDELLPQANRFDDLRELADWIRGASLYIGNDSGITHLAAATGVPTLALFGNTSPTVWAPRGNTVTVLQHQPLAELKVEAVAVSIRELCKTAY